MQVPSPVLDISNLTVAYRHRGMWLDAVREFSLQVNAGETVGLVGESGSGKTTVSLAIVRYLGNQARIHSGSIRLNGIDLLRLRATELRKIWGNRITLVPQNPQSALNPSMRIGEQMMEPLEFHLGLGAYASKQRAIELLEMVRIADPERVIRSYPHQISGGMKQRIMIAMALSTEPDLILLDEPTTNLDVTTQAVILDLIRDLITERQTAVLYVTHDLGVVANLSDRVVVIYAGEVMESATPERLFNAPLNPYTSGLLDSIPALGENKSQFKLRSIHGLVPALGERGFGCVFFERCPLAIEVCEQRPALYACGPDRLSRCHRWKEINDGIVNARQPVQENFEPAAKANTESVVLQAKQLSVHFSVPMGLNELFKRKEPKSVRAVNDVSFSISEGKTLGLVGESGSGKTSAARAIVGLVEATSGELVLLGVPLKKSMKQRDKGTLRHLQMVFQNPEEALNPHMTVEKILSRPLITFSEISEGEVHEKVINLLRAVSLSEDFAGRYPSQLSGGEKQRVAIARAFASNPELILLDEPISSLDASLQASVLNLIAGLQLERATTILLISHDLAVVSYLADQILVIYLGYLMESTDTEDLLKPPHHPYTEALLSAIPKPEPAADLGKMRLAGDLPKPTLDFTGCPFHTRCPRFLGDICVSEKPPWRESNSGKRIFCHIPLTDLETEQG